MTLPSGIASEAQKLATDRLVKLYEIDATDLGGTIFRFCSTIDRQLQIASLIATGNIANLETSTPHTLEDLDLIRVFGAEQPEYNGLFPITVIDAYNVEFSLPGSPAAPASGAYLAAVRLNSSMKFDGNEYTAVEIEVAGFEWNGQGSQATPTFSISNKYKILAAATMSLNNLRGAKFTRIRTFRKHLDDGTDPNPEMIFPREVLRINRKTAQNKVFMEFELANPLDQEGAKLPRAQCLRNTCTHRYRVWNPATNSFDYTKATCPYTGDKYFTRSNQPTSDPSLDDCSRQPLKGCPDRFGSAPLPTRAIPGIGGR